MTKPQAILSSEAVRLVHSELPPFCSPPTGLFALIRFVVVTSLSFDWPQRTHGIVRINHLLLCFRKTSFGKKCKVGEFVHTGFLSGEPHSVPVGCVFGIRTECLDLQHSLWCLQSREHAKMCRNGLSH